MSDHVYPPWEPPFAGSETEHLLGSLDRLRATFRWKADGLDTADMRTSMPSSALTVGGLLKRVAVQEDNAALVKVAGQPLPSVWDDNGGNGNNDWAFSSAAEQSAAELYALYDAAVDRARDIVRTMLDERGIEGRSAVTLENGTTVSVRRILFDLLEEYGRHTRHIDLLRRRSTDVSVRIRRWSGGLESD
jgi:Protein of unknown function (DUF664)